MKFIITIFFFIVANSSFPQNINDWQTYFEKSGYKKTPPYEETINYFQRLADYSDYAEIFTFGISPQGRESKCFIVSKDKAFTPSQAKKTNKPIILIVNGIHSGEIEGKDASMMLLREILVTKEKEWMIDDVILLVIPVFSADGHERFGKYNRINQNGPEEMGWRTTAQNLNLNRDWMKADAPEMQAMLKLFSDWLPDFIIDNHTTNGADYQYTITFSMEYFPSSYSETETILRDEFSPFLHNKMEKAGFLSFRYVGFKDWRKGFESGIIDGPAPPRFSTGYAAVQNRPALLIETHMLKPFKGRVFSTKAAIEAVIEFCSKNKNKLIELNRRADTNTVKNLLEKTEKLPVKFKISDDYKMIQFKGIKAEEEESRISEDLKTVYTGEKIDIEVKLFNDVQIEKEISVPKYYIIPKEWSIIAGRLNLHGTKVEILSEEKTFDVKRYRFTDVKFAQTSYEGRQRVSFTVNEFYEKIKAPAGSFIVNTDQRTIKVIAHLLEPESEDSFVKWGFFNTIFEQKEYFEAYVMEKIAEEMIKENPSLLKKFEEKLAEDEKFRNDPNARLNFFYERSPYYDSQLNVYPVMRVE
jgi:murein tripeptide amidase MpaA